MGDVDINCVRIVVKAPTEKDEIPMNVCRRVVVSKMSPPNDTGVTKSGS